MRHALWPRPDMFDRALARDGVPNKEGKLEAVEGDSTKNPQIIRYRRFPDLAAIGRKPSTIVFAAIASFNASITGHKLTLFATTLAGREWPFINGSLAQLLPDPMSIAGPTFTVSLANLKVNDGEQISQFLARLEGELRLFRRYQHVPWESYARLAEEDRAVVRDAYRQIWNHVPNGTGPKDSISGDEPWRLVSDTAYTVDRTNKSFTWETEFKDAERLRIRAMFNPDMFSEMEVERFTESVLDAVGFLSDTENWGKEFRELRAMLSEKVNSLSLNT